MRGHSITMHCEQCGKPFQAAPSRVARGGAKVCSGACRGARQATTAESFWSKVDRETTPDGCWPWTGTTKRGYGAAHYLGKAWQAHRLAWFFAHGPIPNGLIVRHKVCDNKPCCRPDHLLLGTTWDNKQDAIASGRDPRGERHWIRCRPELLAKNRGERNYRSTVTDDVVREIRRRYVPARGALTRIARELGVSYHVVRHVALGESWKHVT